MEEYAERKKVKLKNPGRTDREIIEHALGQLPAQATREERSGAIREARAALEELSVDANEVEELQAAREAVAPVAEQCQRRLRSEDLVPYVWMKLPFPHSEKDKKEARELVAELLDDLPVSMSDFDVDGRVEEQLKPLARRIERRNRRRGLIEHGRRHVAIVLGQLYRDKAIDREEWLDSEFQRNLEDAVVDTLTEESGGSETNDEVEEIVVSAVDDELDLEPEEID